MAVETIAETCDRTRSWLVVRALRQCIAGEGEELLDAQRGRDQIASGQSGDSDYVLRELKKIVASKAARCANALLREGGRIKRSFAALPRSSEASRNAYAR